MSLDARRRRHHAALATLHAAADADGLAIWRNLRHIESVANRAACDACRNQKGSDAWPAAQAQAEADVKAAFGGTIPTGFFVNGDPRGYTLKLDNEKVEIPEGLVTDWGGYGCLAARIDR